MQERNRDENNGFRVLPPLQAIQVFYRPPCVLQQIRYAEHFRNHEEEAVLNGPVCVLPLSFEA